MQKRFLGFLLGGLLLLTQSSCNQLSAGDIKSNFQNWVTEITTPNKSTLVKIDNGFVIKGSIKNKPNVSISVWEMLPEQLVFIDSAKTDKNGNFVLHGNTKELIFCTIKLPNNQGIYLALDNNSKLQINMELTNLGVSYKIEGKEKEDGKLLKDLIDLNSSFGLQLKEIENKAKALPNTPEAYTQGMELQQQYYGLLAEREKQVKALMFGIKEGFIPYFIITYGVLQNPDLDMYTHAVDCAQKTDKNSKYTAAIEQKYAQESRFMIGGEAPNIQLAQPEGGNLDLYSLRGKVVLIDFWASWCGPCRRENPNVRRLYKRFKDKGFEIYGVSLDQDLNRWKGAIATDSLTWKHVSDLKGWQSTAAALYDVHSIPQTFLLDKNGKIAAKGLRGEELEAKLEELLGR